MTDSAQPPVILVATVDSESRGILDRELRGRYGSDYEIVTCDSTSTATPSSTASDAGDATSPWCSRASTGVDRDGLTFLRRARAIHPSAKRTVVVTWGDFDSAAPVFRAIAEGHAEAQLLRPERRRDEEFHGSITDLLDDWHLIAGHRIRGGAPDRSARRAHPHPARRLRSQPHPHRLLRRRLAARAADAREPSSLDDPELPVLVLQFTSPPTTLTNPTDIEIADAFGLMTPPSADDGLRRRHRRRRAGGPRRGGLRGFRGPAHPGDRAHGSRRPGRNELVDPQLPRLLTRHQRRPPGVPVVPAGLGVRRRVPVLAPGGRRSRSTVTRRVVIALRRHQVRARVRDRCHWRRLPPPRGSGTRGADRAGRLLRRGGLRGAGDAGRPVFVIGGGNSAGQAALHLAKYAEHVTLLVRGAGLAAACRST